MIEIQVQIPERLITRLIEADSRRIIILDQIFPLSVDRQFLRLALSDRIEADLPGGLLVTGQPALVLVVDDLNGDDIPAGLQHCGRNPVTTRGIAIYTTHQTPVHPGPIATVYAV